MEHWNEDLKKASNVDAELIQEFIRWHLLVKFGSPRSESSEE